MLDSRDPTNRPWLRSYDPEVPYSIDYENVPIFAFLDRAAEEHPKRVAIRFKNWKMTYAELKAAAERVAGNLHADGFQPGDRISMMLPNLPQMIISFWGALKAGGVVVMTNPLYMEKEIVHQISDSGARHMILLDHLWPKIEKLKDKLDIDKYYVTRIPDGLRFPLSKLYRFKAKKSNLNLTVPFDKEKVIPWKKLAGKCKKPVSVSIGNPKETLALLQYTGGTTGVPKGVMLSHYNMVVNAQQCRAMLHSLGREGTHESFVGVLPYFHVYGLTVCLMLPSIMAATLLPLPRFIPKDLLETIDKHKPSVFPGAPSVYIALLQQKNVGNYNLSSINYCVSGSAPLPVEVIKQFKEKANAKIIEGYGLTEASPVTHLNPLKGKTKPGSIGLPFPDTETRIVDMELGTVPLPPGKVGEMIIKGPQVMMGYWGRPEETASALRNKWLYTGDIATMDEEGYFSIVDRKKDMIIAGGYNVYPREIDEVLHEHPKVQEAVAVGVPHKTRGEIIKAYIVPVNGETIERSEIIAFCKEKLANYKVPKRVEFREELPKTIVGKVLRRTLRSEEEQKITEKKTKGKAPAPKEETKAEETKPETSAETAPEPEVPKQPKAESKDQA